MEKSFFGRSRENVYMYGREQQREATNPTSSSKIEKFFLLYMIRDTLPLRSICVFLNKDRVLNLHSLILKD